jgi:hypothetical protein
VGTLGTMTTGSALPTSISDVASNLSNSSSKGSCSGTDTVPDSSGGGDLCSEAQGPGGTFDSTVFDQLLSQAKTVQKTVQCKLGQYANIQSEMSCMQSQASALQTQIQSLSTSLQTNLSKQANDVSTIDAVITDRTNQKAQADSRLSSLQAAQGALTTALNTFSSNIASQQATVTSIAQARAQLVVTAQQRTMALTSQCFQNTPNAAYQCSPNGPPVSAEQYVLCRVYQNQFLNSKGQVVNSSTTQNAGTAAQQGLQAVLNNIFSATSTFQSSLTNLSANAQDPASVVAVQEQSTTITSPSDIETQFGSTLMGFDTPTLPVHDTIMNAIRSCYATEQAAVANEEVTPGTQLYTRAQQITQQETTTKAQVDQETQDMSSAYTQAMAALTLTHVPLSTTTCTSANLQNEMNCVTDLQAQLRGALYGNTSTSSVSENIPTNDTQPGSSAINFTCQGLQGCATAYQAVDLNLTNEITRLNSSKQTYITNANSATDSFLNSIKTALSGQSQALQLKMQQLNSQLASMGISPISTSTEQYTPMSKNGDGLYTMPNDLLAVVGGGLTPPMLDMSGDPFTQGLQQIAQSQQDEQSKATDAANEVAQIQQEEASCKSQGNQNMLARYTNEAKDLITTCAQVDPGCQSSGSALQDLARWVDTMNQGSNSNQSSDLGSSIDPSLASGVAVACGSSGSKSSIAGDLLVLQSQYGITPSGTDVDCSSRKKGSDLAGCNAAVAKYLGDYPTSQSNNSQETPVLCVTQAGKLKQLVENLGSSGSDSSTGAGAQ